MTTHDLLRAMADIRSWIDEANHRHAICGLPPLHELDRTWPERAREIQQRAGLVAGWAARDDLDSMLLALDALGAHVIACKLAIYRAQEVRVEAGADGP